jgi:hypothetical protein
VLFAVFRYYGYDDPYITYRYAANLAAGHGFVYNPGDQTLSTTTPLYALLLALPDALGAPVPLVSNALGCLSLCAGALALWYLGQHWQTPLVGAVAAVLYPFAPLLVTSLGSEIPLFLALVLGSFLACVQRRYLLMALALALATLTRGDALVAASVAGLYVMIDQRGNLARLPWRAALLFGGIVLVWAIFGWTYFGSPLPATLAAKQQQGLLVGSQSFVQGLGTRFSYYWEIPLFRVHSLLVLIGLIGLSGVQRYRAWWLVIGWSIAHTIAYGILGVTSYFWYYTPLIVSSVVLIGIAVAAMTSAARRMLNAPVTYVLVGVIVGVLLLPQITGLRSLAIQGDPRLPVYRTIGEWLHTHTPADAHVAVLEVGIIGYYAQRPMIDFAGLIQPTTAARFTHLASYSDAAIWVTQEFRPDYVVLVERAMQTLETSPDFTRHCQRQQTFLAPPPLAPHHVYACTW